MIRHVWRRLAYLVTGYVRCDECGSWGSEDFGRWGQDLGSEPVWCTDCWVKRAPKGKVMWRNWHLSAVEIAPLPSMSKKDFV